MADLFRIEKSRNWSEEASDGFTLEEIETMLAESIDRWNRREQDGISM